MLLTSGQSQQSEFSNGGWGYCHCGYIHLPSVSVCVCVQMCGVRSNVPEHDATSLSRDFKVLAATPKTSGRTQRRRR